VIGLSPATCKTDIHACGEIRARIPRKLPQTHALDRAASGISVQILLNNIYTEIKHGL
jgi:hypothetical protein